MHPLFRLIAVGVVALSTLALPTPMHVGPQPEGGYVVATGQRVRPVGQSVTFAGRPIDLALAPDGKALYVKDNRGLVVIATETWQLRQELAFPSGGGSMHGIAVAPDGRRLFLTTAQNILWEATVQADGTVAWGRKIALPGPGGKGDSDACGLALLPDGKRLLVCLSRNNSLGIVDLKEGRLTKEIPVGIAPYAVALASDARTAYVSDWGGRHPEADEPSADSAGTKTLIDRRGVGASGCVSFVDLAAERQTGLVETGLHPSGLQLSPDGKTLYVANANSDTVSAISTETRKVVETISARPNVRMPFGNAPNALALSADGRTLYVANGGNNALAVIERRAEGSVLRGLIPTGWYPGGVVSDGRALYIANVKGLGSRTEDPKQAGHGVYQYMGLVQRVWIPTPETLRLYTIQAKADANIPQAVHTSERTRAGRKPLPIPERDGEPSVFAHVVYILKENRTYDQVFGDLKQGDGDPNLCTFGYEVTPNHHALAAQFVLLDNYYCNGVLSADGHSWATEGNCTDHLEKAFGGFTRSYTFGDDPLTYSASGFLWDRVLEHGLTFRNFGEMDYAEPIPANASFHDIYTDFLAGTGKIRFIHSIGIENLRRHSAPDYPGWNLRIPDVLRADLFLKELKADEAKGAKALPNLTLLYLPNDHTSGRSAGMPTPRAQIADNDLALGRIVDALSRSRFWPKTCIFVNEDDPQDGFDHVDGHRSLCLVISPYTKRGRVVHAFYNQTSALHTMERILGVPPMNQMDAQAPVMADCFQTTPDYRAFTALPNRIPLDEMNPTTSSQHNPSHHEAHPSAALDFSRPDRADADTLNRILWHTSKGANAPYPKAFAGAHGKGLKSRGLKLDGETHDSD